MLGIDKCAEAAGLLGLGNDVQSHRGFTGRFRSEDFNNTSAGNTADAKRGVQGEHTGGNHGNVLVVTGAAQLHDCARAELLVDLSNGMLQCLEFFFFGGRLTDRRLFGFVRRLFCCHGYIPLSVDGWILAQLTWNCNSIFRFLKVKSTNQRIHSMKWIEEIKLLCTKNML